MMSLLWSCEVWPQTKNVLTKIDPIACELMATMMKVETRMLMNDDQDED